MSEWYEVINWGVVVSSMIFGWCAGWSYGRYRTCRTCLGGVLFILWKLHKRGVYFAPYDIAVINVAVSFIRATK
jgi:hypothetical protein